MEPVFSRKRHAILEHSEPFGAGDREYSTIPSIGILRAHYPVAGGLYTGLDLCRFLDVQRGRIGVAPQDSLGILQGVGNSLGLGPGAGETGWRRDLHSDVIPAGGGAVGLLKRVGVFGVLRQAGRIPCVCQQFDLHSLLFGSILIVNFDGWVRIFDPSPYSRTM